MPNRTGQLAFAFLREKAGPRGAVVATRALEHHPRCNAVLRKVLYTRRFFPELDGRTVRVGLTRAASGMAVPGGNQVWFNPSQLSYHTISHEFVHLLQGRHGIPTGERSCDLFSMARHWTLNDTPPYYVRVPIEFLDANGKLKPESARLIHTLACRAIELRRGGKRQYISYFERALAGLRNQPRAASRVTLPGLGLDVDELLVTPH